MIPIHTPRDGFDGIFLRGEGYTYYTGQHTVADRLMLGYFFCMERKIVGCLMSNK